MRTIIILPLMLVPSAAFAGGYLIPNENARDLALSQATVAAQTGPEAAFQNPAALAGQKGLGLSGSLELLFNATTWSDPNLGTASIMTHVNTPPALSVAYGGGFENGINWGLGVNFQVPGGGSLFWPYNWPGAARIQNVQQKAFVTRFGGAIEPIEGVKIGLTANYFRVTEELSQQVSFAGQLGTGSLAVDGGAFSYGVAAELRIPGVPLVLGMDYAHKAHITLMGNAHFSNIPVPFQSVLQDQDAKHAVVTPNVLHTGLSYEILDGLRVMGTWSFERWEEYRADVFVGSKGFSVTVPRNYNNTNVIRLGVEWARLPFLPELTLRLGGLRSISNQPPETISPTLTDASVWAFSGGAGYLIIPELEVNLGYQHAFFDSVTASGPDAFPGTYTTHADLVSLGLTYRPGI